MLAGLRVDQLGGQANAFAGFTHAAFQQMAGTDFLADLRDVPDVRALVAVDEGGVARHDVQRFEAAQLGDDVLR
jgi:hypothetical protein